MTVVSERPTSPPGPKPHWLSGNLREFIPDRLGTLTRWQREYGDVVSVRFGSRPVLFVYHPDFIEQVLVDQNKKFIKHYRMRGLTRTLGNGMLTSSGDFWRSQRKLAQPAFHRDRIASYAGVMVDYTERMLESWRPGQVRDVQDDLMRLTLEIVAKTLFDADIADDSGGASAAMEVLMNNFVARGGSVIPIPRWVPTPLNIKFELAARRLDRIILSLIAERRRTGEDHGDLLSMLMQAQDEESGRGMSDAQLRDEAMTLFMAGHETTANTLAWAFYLLAQHPEVEAKLREELQSVLGDRPPTFDDLPRLRYTGMIVSETLRLYPTVWTLGREAIEPAEVGDYKVPVGMTILMPQWAVHRDPRWFEDPEAFRPERWSEENRASMHRYAYFPFGGGPRICIGNNFALMEASLLLASIAGRFRLELAPDAEVVLLPTITLRPARGLKMVVREPRGATAGRIPLDMAHSILATFGITRPTTAYERWVKEDGFDLKDFDSVLFESPFVFIIDWRSPLDEELEIIANSLARLGVCLQVDLDDEENSGFVSCGSGRRVAVSYGPDDDDFDGVFRALQSVVPPNIEFRTSPGNDGSDTWEYAVLPRDEWADLEVAAPDLIKHFFKPLQ